MSITIKGVSKRFGSFAALDNVSVDVPAGQLVALLGPSGSGKTTLLRVIAGLEVPDEGIIRYDEQDVTHRPARERNLGFVFQHYALFRHMTVFENIAFALRVRRRPEAEVRERVRELLHLVRLEELEWRKPAELSGGQRQRVALARSLAARPRVLLLDEPFGALDAQVRQELRQWLRRLHHEIGVTTILVTHDQEEAFEVADLVVILNKGRIEQAASPSEVFEHPGSAFVMDFLGRVNVFHGRTQGGRVFLGDVEITNSLAQSNGRSSAELVLPPAGEGCPDEERPTAVYVRPHELEIEREKTDPGSVAARIIHVNPAGAVVRVYLETLEGKRALHVEVSPERWRELNLSVGEAAYVLPRRARVFLPERFPEYSI
jgi:sulfate transport system ATP-binding protein